MYFFLSYVFLFLEVLGNRAESGYHVRPRDTNLVSDAVEVLGQLEGGTDERRQAGANPLGTTLSEVFPKDNKQSV